MRRILRKRRNQGSYIRIGERGVLVNNNIKLNLIFFLLIKWNNRSVDSNATLRLAIQRYGRVVAQLISYAHVSWL